MVDVKELRIGNYVWEDYGGIYEVVAISDDIGLKKPNMSAIGGYRPVDVKGLLLTKEQLLKLGVKDCGTLWLGLPNIKSELNFEIFSGTDEIVTTLIGDFSNLILDRIKYVHELQNLYYSLTKRELKFE